MTYFSNDICILPLDGFLVGVALLFYSNEKSRIVALQNVESISANATSY